MNVRPRSKLASRQRHVHPKWPSKRKPLLKTRQPFKRPNPNGDDVVYWITPPEGEDAHDSPRVFHLCADVSPMKDKPVSSGTVTEAYAQNAARITKQIDMEQRQCGFAE